MTFFLPRMCIWDWMAGGGSVEASFLYSGDVPSGYGCVEKFGESWSADETRAQRKTQFCLGS